MASWKLCIFLIICVFIILVIQTEGKRKKKDDKKDGGSRGGGTGVDKKHEGKTGRKKPHEKIKGCVDKKGRMKKSCKKPNKEKGRKGGNKKRKPKKPPTIGLGSSIDDFNMNVYKKMADVNPNNFVFSPFSVYSAMSMLLLGAVGSSKNELLKGLGLKAPIHPAMMSYIKSLDIEEDVDTILDVANNIYVKPGVALNPRFVQKLQRFYNSDAQNFETVNPETAVNEWVANQTDGEITNFLRPGDITPLTIAMLINAVYFKGTWKSPFDDSRTKSLPFFVSPSDSVQTNTMTQMGQFVVVRSKALNAKILELPYAGDRFSFFILLPDTNLTDLEAGITSDLLSEALQQAANGSSNQVDVQIPKFGLDSQQGMKGILKSLGITQIFEVGKAKLKKVTKQATLHVSEVRHRAVIQIDEEGTVGAATTDVGISVVSMPIPVKVNRPFMFILRDKEHGINLFIGRYTDPRGNNLKN